MIGAERLSHAYGDRQAVDGVSLTARPGRVLGLIGPNGSGKTTLLRMLYGSLRPGAGRVTIDERPLTSWARRELARKVAVVVQESGTELTLTVAEQVMLGRLPRLGTFQRT